MQSKSKKAATIAVLTTAFVLLHTTPPVLSAGKDAEAPWWSATPTRAETYPFLGLDFPKVHEEKMFRADDRQANFRAFEGVRDVTVEDGRLCFVMDEEEAWLKWGNWDNTQPLDERAHLFPLDNTVTLRFRQDADESAWTQTFTADGAIQRAKKWRRQVKSKPVHAEGPGTHELTFRMRGNRLLVTPDGMLFVMKAPKGSRMEIESVTVSQDRVDGYARREFTLPQGRVWKAVLDINGNRSRWWVLNHFVQSDFRINGHPVRRPIMRWWYKCSSIDVTPLVRSGRNAVGFYAYNPSFDALAAMRLTVVMESGETVTVKTDDSWLYSPEATEGWDQPGYNENGWTPIKATVEKVIRTRVQRAAAHHGVLELRNPAQRELYYRDSAPVTVNVFLPPGLRNQLGRVELVLAETDSGGGITRVHCKVKLDSFSQAEGALTATADFGRVAWGVYAVSARLLDKAGRTVDVRAPVPLVVIRRIEQSLVHGTDYRDGLDLDLEQAVDFTDADSERPTVDGPGEGLTPRMVTRDGMRYRRPAGNRRGDYFAVKLGAFKHPGDWYLFELDYPDNAERGMEVSVSREVEGSLNSVSTHSGVGVECGAKFYVTDTMRTLRWLHVADSGMHALYVKNLWDDTPAAASALRMYHIRGELPAVPRGKERLFGIHTERCNYPSGYLRVFGKDFPMDDSLPNIEVPDGLNPVNRALKRLHFNLNAADKYIQYLGFAGQNTHIIGSIQYDFNNTPLIPLSRYCSPHVLLPTREDGEAMLSNALDANGLEFFAGIEYSRPKRNLTFSNSGQIALGADTVLRVNAEGLQALSGKRGRSYAMFSWLHPLMGTEMVETFEDVSRSYAHLEHYRGVSHNLSGCGIFFPNLYSGNRKENKPLAWSYDDATWARFEKEEGVRSGIAKTDPDRFAKRAALLRDDPAMREAFLTWRTGAVTELLGRIAAAIRAERGDLELLNWHETEYGWPSFLLAKGEGTFETLSFNGGIDLDGLARIPGSHVGRWTQSWGSIRWSQEPREWFMKESPDIAAAFDGQPRRTVMCRSSWHETNFRAPGHQARSGARKLVRDWMVNWSIHRTHPQPSGESAREALIQAIVLSDPEWTFTGFTDATLNIGHEQTWREVMSVFTALPRERFRRVLDTDLTTNLAIRMLKQGGQSWFYVVNPAYWNSRGQLTLTAGADLLHPVTGETLVKGGERIEMPVDLPAFGFAAFRVPSGTLDIHGYRIDRPSERELAHMTRRLDRVAKALQDGVLRDLPREDRLHMQETVTSCRELIDSGAYARAWSQIKDHRFWLVYRDVILKNDATIAQAIRRSDALDVDVRTPRKSYRVNCGMTEPYKDFEGRVWLPDMPYVKGVTAYGYDFRDEGKTTDRGNIEVANTEDGPLYQTERYGNPVYTFAVPNGRYALRLHFMEGYRFRPGEYKMDVIVEGQPVLKDWDMNRAAGAFRRAYIHTLEDVEVKDGELDLSLPNGKIMAIEIEPSE